MSADFWAGYVSGAIGILVGNPLDILKVQRQAGYQVGFGVPIAQSAQATHISKLRGASAPILGYGALNALLFVSYNRTILLFDRNIGDLTNLERISLSKIWVAGAIGGLATWVVSAPTELIKCKAQLSLSNRNSWDIAQAVWKFGGLKGFYQGGALTSARDSIGYGFYFSSYELGKRIFVELVGDGQEGAKILLCGGLAGVVTWASIFPLDVVKTRLQGMDHVTEKRRFLRGTPYRNEPRVPAKSSVEIARDAYREGGIKAFFRGFGVCSGRAFIVNATQWTVYEWIMRSFGQSPTNSDDSSS